MKRKFLAIIEILLVVSYIFSFSFLVSDKKIFLVSAQSDGILRGCCLETKAGAICQDIPFFQKDLCKSNFFGTPCSFVEQCQLGCCYSPNTGTCSFNAPKNKCLENGGEWVDSPSCNIPSCQLGCCILGSQVVMSNLRECSLLSGKYNFEKNFIFLQPGDSCERYRNLEKTGACLTEKDDYSGEKNCVFTTKKNCRGEFKEGYLCTSKELNTICKPTKRTSCIEGKDEVYFLDSCGNIANVYDASRAEDQNYWEKVISPENSCSSVGPACGNCNYFKGSVCSRYEKSSNETKPTYGDYFCKNLNCGERKNGESWCVYDFDPNSGVSPVGSRHFIARCIDGKIKIEGCADFMQEICAETRDNEFGFSEAKCFVNDWRSCLIANDESSYEEVERKCNENPQCVMFDDFYGKEKLKRSDGEFFAGFNPSKINIEQGAIDDYGRDQNKILSHCVPRFTPGFQFWSTKSSPTSSQGRQVSNLGYGGSKEESSAICSLGNFVCVSEIHRYCTLLGGCDPWEDEDRNWECNYNGVHSTIKTKDLPNLLSALNERCRALGSCGVSTNIAGKINKDFPGYSVKRLKIDRKGKIHENFDSKGYKLPESYLSQIRRTITNLTKLEQVKSSGSYLSVEDVDGIGSSGSVSPNVINMNQSASGIDLRAPESFRQEILQLMGPLSLAGVGLAGKWLVTPSYSFKGFAFSGRLSPGEVYKAGPDGALIVSGSKPLIFEEGAIIKGINGDVETGAVIKGQPNNFLNGLKAAGIKIASSLVAGWVGSMVGGLIAKGQGWSPGKTQKFIEFVSQVFGFAGYIVGSGIAASALGVGGTTFGSGVAGAFGFGSSGIFTGGLTSASTLTAVTSFLSFVGTAVAIAMIIYTGFFDEYKEQEFFLMQFICESWSPPRNGNCEICNNDVRPCSEYRCRSLGSNCYYFIENGEPGYCASISQIWSAKIKPWEEVLTRGNKYSEIKSGSFKIVGEFSEEIDAWKPLTFGIITDKPAICRIDSQHTKSFEDMRFEMLSVFNEELGKQDNTKHLISLSPFVQENSNDLLKLKHGEENTYYIRCMNFAGQINEAEFLVRLKVKDEPDLTPPMLIRFDPESGSFLKKGTTSAQIKLFVNEPSECKFVKDYDVPTGESGYEEMPNNLTCLSESFAGEWTCLAILQNLTEGQNTFFFRCKDQSNISEEDSEKRGNVNFNSKEYKINVCADGLDISVINDKTMFEEKNFTLSIRTSGCLSNATCSYRVKEFTNSFSRFFETGTNIHSQFFIFDAGNHQIEIFCEDNAGNLAYSDFNFTIISDEEAPIIERVFNQNGKLVLLTNEPAECRFSTNISQSCFFSFNDSISYLSKKHISDWNPFSTYFIKCRDKRKNSPQFCSLIIKPN